MVSTRRPLAASPLPRVTLVTAGGTRRDDGGVSELRAPGDVLVHLRRARDHADRAYAEPLALDELAAVANLSKYHLVRLFKATYGRTPMEYVSQRRIERAQDLLRATNLTVTEVCSAVGFSSLGSFSSRFRALVGESPSEFQRRNAEGAPDIPGGFVFMWGLEGYRSCTVIHPSQPELLVSLAVPGPPHSPELVEAMKRAQEEGGMHGLGLNVDDCEKTYEDLRAKGVEFIQPPSKRPYGTEALCRDNSGNWLVLVEPSNATLTAADFQ